MPRRNRRRPANEPTDFTKLARELGGRTERRAVQPERAPRRVTSLDEARALLGL